MNKIIAFIILLTGCTSFSDYSANFLVSGEVMASGKHNFSLRMTDINLDDTRNDYQRIILDKELNTDEKFIVNQSYFWGSAKLDAYKKAKVKIVITQAGCKSWEKIFFIHEFYNTEKVISINVGSVVLQCGS